MALWMWWCDWNMLQKKSLIFTGLSHEYMKQQFKIWLNLRPTTNSALPVDCIDSIQHWTYNEACMYTQVYMCIHWVYTGQHGHTQVYTNIRENTRVYTSIHRCMYAWVYRSIHEYTQVYTGACMHEYIGVYTSIYKYTQVHVCTSI